MTAYNRIYSKTDPRPTEYKGIRIVNLKTVNTKGFDTLLHSLKATWHIIRHNNADVVHIRNGGNSMWAVPLRLSGKKVYVSEDGVDWRRDKWPWYGKAYLYLSTFLTARVPNGVIFDNIFAKRSFEERFGREYYFISTGSENPEETLDPSLLSEMGLTPGDYLLFVGRFIPEKGLHYLIPAFEKTETEKSWCWSADHRTLGFRGSATSHPGPSSDLPRFRVWNRRAHLDEVRVCLRPTFGH